MLQSCIVGPLEKPVFQPTDALIPLRVVRLSTVDQVVEVVNTELNQKIESGEPLLRGVLVNFDSDPEVQDLITIAHHGVCDAQLTVHLHEELLGYCAAIAAGESPSVTPLPELPPVDALLPNPASGLSGILRALVYALSLGLKWIWHRVRTLSIDTCVPLGDRTCHLIPHQLTSAQTQAFRAQCRQQGITMQSGLCAALLQSIARQIATAPEQPFTVSCDSAIDLRRRLPPTVDPTSFFSGAMWVRTFHAIQPGIGFWNFAQTVEKALARSIVQQEMFNCAIAALPMVDFVLKHPEAVHSTAFVSNLGAINVRDRYGKLRLEQINFTASNSAFAGMPALYASTFGGRMQLNFMFSEPALSRATMNAIVEQTVRLIDEQGVGVFQPLQAESVGPVLA